MIANMFKKCTSLFAIGSKTVEIFEDVTLFHQRKFMIK